MNTSLVIMAAGVGSRYGKGIKQLEELGPNNEALMEYSIHDAIEAGFNEVVFITREDLYDIFEERVGKKVKSIIPVKYVFQKLENLPDGVNVCVDRCKPWGTGHAVLESKKCVNNPFVVINADDYYGKQAFKMMHDYLVSHSECDKDGKYNFCMAGFILKNTLSDNGSVTRGVCVLDNNENLAGVCETENIIKTGDGGVASKKDDDSLVYMDGSSNVSMNMWGFTPDIYKELEKGFIEFLNDPNNDLNKKEYLLPTIVDKLIKSDKASVKVLETHDKWFGVTYAADKECVCNALKCFENAGIYPDDLYGC